MLRLVKAALKLAMDAENANYEALRAAAFDFTASGDCLFVEGWADSAELHPLYQSTITVRHVEYQGGVPVLVAWAPKGVVVR